jgi:hypothetical protein
LTVHSSASTDASRSSRIVVSAVVTTSASSATMKEAIDVRARTHLALLWAFMAVSRL